MNKILKILIIVTLLASMLAGCATKDVGDATGSNGNEETTTTQDETNDAFTLRISTTGPTDDNIDIAERIFKEKYPNATIEYIVSPWGETREKQLILTSMGDIPDIAKTGGWVQEFYKEGVFDNLTDEVMTWDIYDKFTPGQLERMVYGDEICALNYNTNTILLLYNKDILAELGVDVPKSFEDLEKIGEQIKEKSYTNLSGNKVFATNVSTHPWEIGAWIWSNDGVFMDEALSKTLINTPESIKAHAYAQSFVKNEYAPMPDGTMDQMWLNGQLATYLTGEWSLPSTFDAGINVGVTTVPVGKSGKTITSTGGADWAVFAGAENKKMAYEFLKIMYSEEFQIQADRGVTDLEIYNNSEKQAFWKESGLLEAKMAQQEQLKYTKYQYMDGPYKYPEGRSIYVEALERLFINLEDSETILNEAAEKINANY
ncbi:MAG: hypothetical protein CVU98_01925 [Firmicutes bacterium HGW-Firmicutes-3]|jgi:ABC-type glycerol-3-phosphate transport system substrate-binding protein|nr:MAG: hypothetical protein CVU98_01925 [Firmicutes bacterium HGW-Firmicutes-3]